MLSVLMISRSRRSILALGAVVAVVAAFGCQKVPLLAPSGSTITLTVSATALPINGTTDVLAQVIESAGTPPHSGTQVTFTTTLGTIEPSSVSTDVNGMARATFHAGAQSGTATITASSGGATASGNNAAKIAVGSAAVGHVTVSANPATVSALGGSTTITANVLDVNGNVLPSAPVTFTTTAGTLSQAVVASDANGNAQTTLQTAQQATVTASVGAQATGGGTGTGGGSGTGTGTGSTSGQASGTVTVNVSAAPTLVITPPTTAPSAGLPASYTFAVTAASSNGSAVRDVTVSWGDGATQDLGAITGSQVVYHIYRNTGTYTITAILTDAFGNRSPVSTVVSVIPVPRPSINIQATPGQTGTNTATFTITVTAPSGIAIQDVTINFGDGTSQDLGGAPTGTLSNIIHTYASAGQKNVQVTVLDSAGQSTVGTTTVTVS
jgi:adhesin/invasin